MIWRTIKLLIGLFWFAVVCLNLLEQDWKGVAILIVPVAITWAVAWSIDKWLEHRRGTKV